jgi:hypothetical protein
MAWGIDGAMNALVNSKNWSVHHELNQYMGSKSPFGIGGIIPAVQGAGNWISRPFRVIGGFVFGSEKEDVPRVSIPDLLKDTTFGRDVVTYQKTKEEANVQGVQSLKLKVEGVLTLNVGKFNEGSLVEESTKHNREKEKIILPSKAKEEMALLPSIVPNVIADAAKKSIT